VVSSLVSCAWQSYSDVMDTAAEITGFIIPPMPPKTVKSLKELLRKQVDEGRITPGPEQNNDVQITINKNLAVERGLVNNEPKHDISVRLKKRKIIVPDRR
jgi:hypothetical protein